MLNNHPITIPTPRRYGWRPDKPDQRDRQYSVPRRVLAAPLPPSVDLRPWMPPVYDQGQLGSCTGNATAGGHQFAQILELAKIKGAPVPSLQALIAQSFVPSRLFIYYNERSLEGTVNTDAGAEIRDGIKSLAALGACPETLWPYNPSAFAQPPPAAAYTAALKSLVTSYSSLNQDMDDLRGCLASGFPFVFGFSVYESFEAAAIAQTGVMPMPAPSERVLGGHAVLAVGYDDARQVVIVRNSWGADWGDAGYFYMPYAFLTDDNNADDFWTIRLVEE